MEVQEKSNEGNISQAKKRSKSKPSEEKIIDVISKSIGQVLLLSANEDFRRKSFELFNVSSLKEVEELISKGLSSISTSIDLKEKLPRKKKKSENTSNEPELESSYVFTLEDLAGTNDLEYNTDSSIHREILLSENILKGAEMLQADVTEQPEGILGLNDDDSINLQYWNILAAEKEISHNFGSQIWGRSEGRGSAENSQNIGSQIFERLGESTESSQNIGSQSLGRSGGGGSSESSQNIDSQIFGRSGGGGGSSENSQNIGSQMFGRPGGSNESSQNIGSQSLGRSGGEGSAKNSQNIDSQIFERSGGSTESSQNIGSQIWGRSEGRGSSENSQNIESQIFGRSGGSTESSQNIGSQSLGRSAGGGSSENSQNIDSQIFGGPGGSNESSQNIYSQTPVKPAEEEMFNSQSSFDTQKLLDQNWLEISIKKFKGRPYKKIFNRNRFSSACNSNLLNMNSQHFDDNYLDLENSQNLNYFANADFQQDFTVNNQNYLEANIRSKKSK